MSIKYSRRRLSMMSTNEIQEKYVTKVRLKGNAEELKEVLKERGVIIPEGSNPRSLVN